MGKKEVDVVTLPKGKPWKIKKIEFLNVYEQGIKTASLFPIQMADTFWGSPSTHTWSSLKPRP